MPSRRTPLPVLNHRAPLTVESRSGDPCPGTQRGGRLTRCVGDLHDAWAKEFRKNNPRKKRFKQTTDDAWIAEGTGKYEGLIAHTAYENLPADWQEENLAAATVATRYVADRLADTDKLRNGKRARAAAGAHIHDAWLSRNTWAKGDPNVGVPFSKLSQEEKDKDLAQLDAVLSRL